jgi:hypothetical protein
MIKKVARAELCAMKFYGRKGNGKLQHLHPRARICAIPKSDGIKVEGLLEGNGKEEKRKTKKPQ